LLGLLIFAGLEHAQIIVKFPPPTALHTHSKEKEKKI
jgi:hypothetical protein